MADNVLGLYFEISADPTKAVQALSTFRAASERESNAVTTHLRAMQSGAEQARAAHQAAFGQMTHSVQDFGAASLDVSAQLAAQVTRAIQLNNLDATSHAKTQASKLSASVQAIKALSAIKAVHAFAKGLEALGDLNFWSAAQYFAAAALYGTQAAIQISAMLGGGGGGGRARAGARENVGAAGGAGAATGPVALASGAASALERPGGNVTVLVMGEPQAAAWLTKTINQGVLQQDLMLVSSHTKRSAPAGR
jgi:hypothetical protein